MRFADRVETHRETKIRASTRFIAKAQEDLAAECSGAIEKRRGVGDAENSPSGGLGGHIAACRVKPKTGQKVFYQESVPGFSPSRV
jgi:hypothetical protein